MNRLHQLKISLMSHGVKFTPAAHSYLSGDEDKPLSLFDYVTTSGLVLILPGNIYANANFREEFCRQSENMLDYEDRLMLRSPHGDVEVACMPVPSYYNRTLPSGRPVTEVIMTHADRMRISPIRGCNNRCQFCDLGTAFPYQKAEFEDLDEALRIALADEDSSPKHLLISGGTPKKEDEPFLDTAYRRIIRNCPVPVDVMLAPRDNHRILEQLLEWGCHGLAINMEINDENLASRIMPEKYRIGKRNYLKFIEKAVQLFGKGKVRSCIILGLEPEESTLEGVRLLTELGCDPVLSTFKPLKGTALEQVQPPSPALQQSLYTKTESITVDYNVVPGPRCIPCQHNALAFPLDGGEYFFS